MLLTSGIRGLMGKAAPTADRPSMTPYSSVVGAISGSTSKQEQLQAIALSSWVFAVVEKIATGTAAPQWQLYKGDDEIEKHPFLDFWEKPNPFMTGAQFREIGAQHFELTGETWWAKVYTRGQVTELWPLRPDRVRPVPHTEKFLAGYIYQIGAERVPYAPEDVVSIRRPHPYDPYRGIGPIENLMMDLQSERQASVWTRNFYVNNASPGGVVQMEENMSDSEFEKFRSRWEIMHKGVNNAHRVAFLEGGMEWKDARLSQRDMQFVDWRKLNRDVIIGAWGLPGAVLGISETVDRAASESAEAMFARWVIVPRLNRIREAVNTHLLPLWGEDLRLDYVNPVPDDRALDLQEATQGYTAGFVTMNEARIKLDLPPLDGPEGDEFKAPAPSPFGDLGSFGEDPEDKKPAPKKPDEEEDAQSEKGVRSAEDEVDVDPLIEAELAMRKGWRLRLAAEAVLIAELVGSQAKLINIDAHNWDWLARFGEAVQAELRSVFMGSLVLAGTKIPQQTMWQMASDYAEAHGGRLITGVRDATRQRVGTIVRDAIAEGKSGGQIERAVRQDFIFSRERARMVARTETAIALGQGHKQAAAAEGRSEKHWVTRGQDVAESICLTNEAANWIQASAVFPSGHDVIPAHPNCLPGDSLVLARGIAATSERRFDGEVVTVRTASGKNLTCTPNHPVLTDAGWVAARLLVKGGYVVSGRGDEWKSRLNLDHQNVPASIEEIVQAFGRARGVSAVPVPTSPKDFHGDGKGSEVAVIRAYGLLGPDGNTALGQHPKQQSLVTADVRSSAFTSDGAQGKLFAGNNPAARRSMGGFNLGGPGAGGFALPVQQPRFAGAARGDALPAQVADNSLMAYAIPDADTLRRLTGDVCLDQIVAVEWRPFGGQVYNLETVKGFYVAGGIVTHNCGCVVRYRMPPTEGDPDPLEDIDEDIAEAIAGSRAVAECRCPKCNRMVGRNVVKDSPQRCPRCKTEFKA